MKSAIAVVGECMLQLGELQQADDPNALNATLSYGGDTLNTALYLARLGVQVDYVTGVGDDSMSDWLISRWEQEKIGCEHVERFPGGVPGLYLIELDAQGERTFKYWRKGSPASRLFDEPVRAQRLYARLSAYPNLYLSGITLALYKAEALDSFLGFLHEYAQGGGKVFFDGNYRASLWSSPSAALEVFKAVYSVTEVALPTLDDEIQVTGIGDPELAIEQLKHWGVKEIALKMGGEGSMVSHKSQLQRVSAHSTKIVDTTSAGDSFNAGYIAARLAGKPPVESANLGNRLAAVVIQHRGAVIAADLMPF
jgi:2-dehydro-3-deoxygluconokinase